MRFTYHAPVPQTVAPPPVNWDEIIIQVDRANTKNNSEIQHVIPNFLSGSSRVVPKSLRWAMLAIHPDSSGPNHSTMTIGGVAMLPVPESVSVLRLLLASGTLRYSGVTVLSSRNPRWIESCGPPTSFRDR